jgi:pimeloyl-ACP methyl ester carboxylesterase
MARRSWPTCTASSARGALRSSCTGRAGTEAGWLDVEPRFAARAVPALALNLRGYDGSSGAKNETITIPNWVPPDFVVAGLQTCARSSAALREQGAGEIALVGASMGGHPVLMSSADADVECMVSISAPVVEIPEALAEIGGRKLFVFADQDARLRAVRGAVQRTTDGGAHWTQIRTPGVG